MSEHTSPAGEDGRYPQVVRSVLETPWAILPRTLASIKEFVAIRAAGGRFTDEEIAARVGAKPARRDAQRAGAVAVIPIHGVITPKADMFTDISGGTSIDRLRGAFHAAVRDPDVTAIVFDVDSPGGQVDLVPEFAAEIRGARGLKPIMAVADTLAASAAYWIASQADEMFVTPSGEVGSIGVFAAHDDISGALEKAGVKTTLVSAGKFKTEGNPFEPLTDDARAAIQARVDDAYRMFVQDVAAGRGATDANVRNGYGQGRVVVASEAVKQGMVDGVATLDEVVARATGAGQSSDASAFAQHVAAHHLKPRAGFTIVEQLSALQSNAREVTDVLTSLCDVKEGQLSQAKRDALAGCPESLREVAEALDGLMAATDPNKHKDVLAAIEMNEIARRNGLHDKEAA